MKKYLTLFLSNKKGAIGAMGKKKGRVVAAEVQIKKETDKTLILSLISHMEGTLEKDEEQV